MCVVTTTTTVTMPEALPTATVPMKESKRLILAHNAARKHPRPLCRKCEWPFGRRDAGIIRKRMCASCEARWLDGIINRLVKRVGRKGAVAALKALAPK